jgi:CheY-like chemotaxis protein
VDFEFTHGGFINIIFTVTDSGIGIKKEHIEHIFDEFSHIDQAAKKGVESTGLGLSIAKNLTKSIGGEIKVESVYGEGSTFTIIIPQKIVSPKPLAVVKQPSLKTVLVLENNPIMIKSISDTMTILQVPFTVAQDIKSFNDNLDSNEFKFIFIAAHLYDRIDFINLDNLPESQILIMTDINDIIDDNSVSVSVPMLPNTLASILNGEDFDDNSELARNSNTFTASDARILVVDDILTNLKVAEGLLEPYNATLVLCQDGQEAIRLIEEQEFDLVFMDHMMPVMDGIEVTKRLRKHSDKRVREIPIIALTANAVSGIKKTFIQAGFNDYLTKPIDLVKLDKVLKKWLKSDEKAPVMIKNERYSSDHLLDVAAGIESTGGSYDNYYKFLKIFYLDLLESVEYFRDPSNITDTSNFMTRIEALKSASESIGASTLFDKMKYLRELCINGYFDVIAEDLPDTIFLIEDFIDRMISEDYISVS